MVGTGRIKWFNSSKGLGFIENDMGQNILFRKNVVKDNFHQNFELKQGDLVRYKLSETLGSNTEASEIVPIREGNRVHGE